MSDTSMGRLSGVLWSPTATFRAIRERPSWGLAFMLLVVVSTCLTFVVMQRMDVMEMIHQDMASKGQTPPPNLDQYSGMIRGCGFVQGILGPPIFYLVVSAIFMVFNLVGGNLRFHTSFSVLLHASIPKALQALVALPIVWSREALSIAEVKSGGFLRSNLAFLAPPDQPVLAALLGSLDFFSIWTVVLLVIGYREGAKVSTGKSAGVVVGLWLFSILLMALFAFVGTLKGS